MKIILTIKSILNYLYNNLIDLIWVKKIKFEDGTELDSLPTSATLFDIKRRSIYDISDEKLVQKGWCCISDSQPKRLAKASVPTTYEFLKDKLDNKETGMSNWSLTNTGGYIPLFYFNGFWYLRQTYGKSIYRTQYLDFSNVELVKQDVFVYGSTTNSILKKAVINNQTVFIAISCPTNYTTNYTIRIYDTNWNIIKEKTVAGYNTTTSLRDFCIAEDVSKIFILPGVHNGVNTEPYKLIVYNYDTDVVDYPQITLGTFENYGTKYIVGCNVVYFKGYVYTASTVKYCKINPNDYSYENKNISENGEGQTDTSAAYIIDNTRTNCFMFTDNENLYMVNSGKFGGFGSVYGFIEKAWKLRNDGTWLNLYNSNSNNGGSSIINELNNAIIHNNTFYLSVLKNNNVYLYSTVDFVNFTELYTFQYNGICTIIINDNNEICYSKTNSEQSSSYAYSAIVPTVYTDTINGIDIKYYKSGDWKICTPNIAVGNDDNLQSVYEYLGYLNYWWIDTANEEITLQRDNIFETFMFVGDDYEDDSLPSGSYSPYATKQDVGNAGHTIIMKFIGNSGLTLDTGESLGNSCIIFKNGNKLSIVDDYTINGSVITFLTPLITSDKIEVVFGNITSIDLSQFKQKAQVVEIDDASITIANVSANTNYVFTSNAITDITLTACETSLEETTIQFTTGNSAPTLTDNSGLVWFGGIPTLLPNTTYVIVIFNKQAFYQEN